MSLPPRTYMLLTSSACVIVLSYAAVALLRRRKTRTPRLKCRAEDIGGRVDAGKEAIPEYDVVIVGGGECAWPLIDSWLVKRLAWFRHGWLCARIKTLRGPKDTRAHARSRREVCYVQKGPLRRANSDRSFTVESPSHSPGFLARPARSSTPRTTTTYGLSNSPMPVVRSAIGLAVRVSMTQWTISCHLNYLFDFIAKLLGGCEYSSYTIGGRQLTSDMIQVLP